MRRAVLLLAAGHLAVTVAVVAAVPASRSIPALAPLLGLVAAFALVGLVPLHLELRRHACTVVLTEAVLVVGLFSLHSAAVVGAAVAGEAIACVAAGQQRLKILYNAAATAGTASLAVLVFTLSGTRGAANPVAWLAAVAAAAVFSGANLLSTSVILAVAEGRRFSEVVAASGQAALVASGASATLGLGAVVLASASRAAPVLLVPLIATVVAGTRRLALQSAEHLRFARLYEASSRSGRLTGFEDALHALADEARGLLTGSAAVCLAARPDGTWVGVLVDDDGARPAPAAAVAELAAYDDGAGSRVIDLGRLDRRARAALPAAADLVVAPAAPGSRARVVLAVFREIGTDSQGVVRAEVLSAFAGHAALAVANALLYEEVEEALRRQLDLNLQKSEFVAAVSHELRTPLTSVLASVATVRRLRGRLDDPSLDRLFTTALDQGERLRRLIDELLLVAAAEHGSMEAAAVPVELAALVTGVVDELQLRSGGRLVAAVEWPGVVVSDEDKLRRILQNLVDNAVKYAPDGPIEVAVRRHGGIVELSVTDHGPGIAHADQERCFERFVQLDQSSTRRQGGTGLGLHLCGQLAELVQGSLTLRETPGGGCTFVLALAGGSLPDPASAEERVREPEPLTDLVEAEHR